MKNMREIATEYRLSHWTGIVQERNASGLSIKAYCTSVGIRPNVYFYWQRKLREAACQELLPAAVSGGSKAVIPNGWAMCEVTQTPVSTNESELTIEIGKSRITAKANVNLELLNNVCRILMSLC